MTVKSLADLETEADTNLADNTTRDISAADVRDLVKNVAGSSQVVPLRVVTAAGDVDVNVTDRIIGINKTVGEATAVNLGPADDRVGQPITIKDLKGDASSNNITPVPDGAETIDGDDGSGYVIATDLGSVTFYPLPGGGWYTLG